jgi:hypothetical protein
VGEDDILFAGKFITWHATAGSFTPPSAATDDQGQVSTTYTAPSVDVRTSVTITASFAGDAEYSASSATSIATVLPLEVAKELENLKENLREQISGLRIKLENENLRMLENAFVRGDLGAVVAITIEVDKPGLAKGYEHEDIRTELVTAIIGEKIEVVVSSEVENGKTVVVNVDNRVLPVGLIARVLVDNVEIGLADSYEDVSDPTDEDVPEYFILKGGRGAQVLVSLPSFSARTITITTLPTLPTVGVPPLYVIVIGAIVIAVVLLAGIWRYVSLGAKKLKLV